MVKSTDVGYKRRPPLVLRKAGILARIRRLRLTEIEPDEGRPFEAMLHWRDPVGRLRILRRRDQRLVDDNPAAG